MFLSSAPIPTPTALVLTLGQFTEYADPNPIGQPTVPIMERDGKGKFAQWVGSAKQPLEQRIQNKRNGIGRQNRPYVGEDTLSQCSESTWPLTKHMGQCMR